MAVERAEDGRRGGCTRGGGSADQMRGDLINEGLETQDIAKKLGLVSAVGGHATALVDLDSLSNIPRKSREGRLTNSIPLVHSSTVRLVSLAKAWRCRTRLGITCARRGSAFGPVAAMTLSVKNPKMTLWGVPGPF